MKELFMEMFYPDIEREYLTDDTLALEAKISQEEALMQEEEFRNPTLNTKIEVANGQTREIHSKEQTSDRHLKVSGSGF